MFCNPFLTAGGTIAVRKARKLHEFVISFWLNFTQLVLNIIFMYVLNQDFLPVLQKMDALDWFYSVMTGVLVIMH